MGLENKNLIWVISHFLDIALTNTDIIFIGIVTVFPNMTNKRILAGLEILNYVLVEGIHVLHQPLLGRVVHISGVVDDTEIGLILQ